MDKELQFAKNKKDLEKKIREIVADDKNSEYVRSAFKAWLEWYIFLNKKIKDAIFNNDLDPNSNQFYRAFVIPAQNFYAIQIWEKYPKTAMLRCVKTLYANKLDMTYWTKNVYDNRKRA